MNIKEFKYVYHVAYMSENNLYGSLTLYRHKKLNNEAEVTDATKFISDEYCNGKAVIILNFILLNKRGR